eukprot:3560957-Pleurochrysis_carterae.AAC.1
MSELAGSVKHQVSSRYERSHDPYEIAISKVISHELKRRVYMLANERRLLGMSIKHMGAIHRCKKSVGSDTAKWPYLRSSHVVCKLTKFGQLKE